MTNSKPDALTSKKHLFHRSEDGRHLYDDDFEFDVRMDIDGDWPSDEARIKYADAVVSALNAARLHGETPLESFIERLRSHGRFYVVPVSPETELALDVWLRENNYKFSIPILPGESLEQALKRQPVETLSEWRCQCGARNADRAHPCGVCGHQHETGQSLQALVARATSVYSVSGPQKSLPKVTLLFESNEDMEAAHKELFRMHIHGKETNPSREDPIELLTVARACLPDPDFVPTEEEEIKLRSIRDRIDAYLRPERLRYTDFDADAVINGAKPLTQRERAFLIEDTPRFEEGQHLTSEGLAKLSDAELMSEAYNVWADYARGQI